MYPIVTQSHGSKGLVQYALTHGQPHNSVLDGIVPLHAACSGGNELVVKLLLDFGADVNAQRWVPILWCSNSRSRNFLRTTRLPRRYSDRNKSDGAIIGSSGHSISGLFVLAPLTDISLHQDLLPSTLPLLMVMLLLFVYSSLAEPILPRQISMEPNQKP